MLQLIFYLRYFLFFLFFCLPCLVNKATCLIQLKKMCRSGFHCLQEVVAEEIQATRQKNKKDWGGGGAEEWESIRIGGRGVQEAGNVRVGGGSAKRVWNGRNRGKLCNNAQYLAIKRGLKGGSQELRSGSREQRFGHPCDIKI